MYYQSQSCEYNINIMEDKIQKIKVSIHKSELNGWTHSDNDNIFNSKSLLSLLQNQIRFPNITDKLYKKQEFSKKLRLKTEILQKIQVNKNVKHLKTLSQEVGNQQFKIKTYQNQSKQILKQTLYSKQYLETDFQQSQFKPFRKISDGLFLKRSRKIQLQQEKQDKIYNIRNNNNIKQQQQKNWKQKLRPKILLLDKMSKSKSLTPIAQFSSPLVLSDYNNTYVQKFQTLNKQQKKNNSLIKITKQKLKLIRNQSKHLMSCNTFGNQKSKTLQGKTTFDFNLNKSNKQAVSQKHINNKHLLNKLLINSKKSSQEKNFNKVNLKLKKNRIFTQPFQLPQFNDTIIYDNVFDVDNNFKMLTNKNILSLSQKKPFK